MKIKKEQFFFIIVFFICLFLVFDKHSKTGINNYHSQLWADPSGYYVYLPATFIYGFHASGYPADIEKNVGHGFSLDQLSDKVVTKYTSGIAILFLPFFLIIHLIAIFFGLDPSGFSPVYYKMINVAAVFYLTLGMYFLRQFLCTYFSKRISTLTIIILFLSTNLYYYSISSPFFTHIYSFFLFCLFLYLLKNNFIDRKPKIKHFILFGIVSALIILIRPTNAVFLLFAIFIDIRSASELKERIMLFLKIKPLLIFILVFLLVFLPQIIYWFFLSHKFYYYSYGNEGFTNWNSPKFLEVMFSTTNGLFIWTPFYFFMFLGLIFMLIKKQKNTLPVLMAFIITLYICASWQCWNFGCGFGLRPFVEYLALLSIPAAYILENMFKLRKKVLFFSGIFLFSFIIYYNLKMIYTYDVCFYGGYWDWREYKEYFYKSRMFIFNTKYYTFYNNFDSPKQVAYSSQPQTIIKTNLAFSGNNVSEIDSLNRFSSGYIGNFNINSPRLLLFIDLTMQVYVFNSPNDFEIIYEINTEGENNMFVLRELKYYLHKIRAWEKINDRVRYPILIDKTSTVKAYIRNNGKDSILIDEFKIKYTY